jgi:hypothetical protein
MNFLKVGLSSFFRIGWTSLLNKPILESVAMISLNPVREVAKNKFHKDK